MPTQTISDREKKRVWLIRNPRILYELAESLNCTYQAVHGVFTYHLPSKHFRIERALADAGAPCMKAVLRERETTPANRYAPTKRGRA